MGILETIFNRGDKKQAPKKRRKVLMSSNELENNIAAKLSQQTRDAYNRKNFTRLEQLYWSEPLVFNGINTWVELICGPGFTVKGDKKDVEIINDLFERTKFMERKLPKIVQHCCIYGNAYTEKRYNQGHEKIVGISDPIDPKSIGFITNNEGIVIVDDNDNPVGYVQKVVGNSIKIPADIISHFKLYSLGASQLGIGLVEPIFWTAIGKRTIDEKIVQQEFRKSNILVDVVVDTDKGEPTPEEINEIKKKVKGLTYRNDITHSDLYELKIHSFDFGENSDKIGRYFEDAIVAGVGLPKAYVTGRGEQTNKSILDTLHEVTQRKVSRRQSEIAMVIEDSIFDEMLDLGQISSIPRIVWNETSPESLGGKVSRMKKEIEVGLLRPDKKVRGLVREWEELPEESKDEDQDFMQNKKK